MSEAARAWSASNAEPPRPMRIEFATSELEGGPCRAWADPSFVLGAVAVSDPPDGFTKLVQPRLEELDAFGEATGGELPPIVTQLVDHLQKIHSRMFRENGTEKQATIALTCAAVEEDRVFFVKTCPAWIGLVRGTRAHAVERPAEEDFARPVGLGASEKLSLEVTSLPVQPGDVVVLLCSDMHATPDLRAVANVFNQTTDLRRACDGLVNLLGLQSEGAGAIAFRFVPVGTSGNLDADPIATLAEVPRPPAAVKVEDPFAAMKTAMPRSSSSRAVTNSEAETFLDSLGGDGEPIASSGVRSPSSSEFRSPLSNAAFAQPGSHSNPGSQPSASDYGPYDDPRSSAGQHAPGTQAQRSHPAAQGSNYGDPSPQRNEHPTQSGSSSYHPGAHPSARGGQESGHAPLHMAPSPAAHSSGSRDSAPHPLGVSPETSRDGVGSSPSGDGAPAPFSVGDLDPRRRRSSRRNLLIPILIVLVIAGLLALMSIPSGPDLPGSGALRNLFGSAQKETGELRIAPDPPARSVLLDGVAVAEGTPTVLPAVEVGRHRIGLDLGLLGVWETDLDVATGANTLAPKLTGSVRVGAADPSVPGQVWVDGGAKSSVPVTLTDIPVGWVRIYYEDEKLPIWERQVLVRADRTSPLVVPNDLADGESRIEVEALSFSGNQGLEPSSGDSIWIDDQPAGVTPYEGSVEPGLHSVRVRSTGGESFTDMIDVHPGGGRHVLAQFGVSERPSLHHTPPGRVALSGKLVLSVEVAGEMDPLSARPALHFPNLDAPLREVPLTPVDEGEQVFVGVVDPRGMPRQSEVRYYFTILGPDGRPVYSDLYRIVLRDASASSARASADPSNLAAQVIPSLNENADAYSASAEIDGAEGTISIEEANPAETQN